MQHNTLGYSHDWPLKVHRREPPPSSLPPYHPYGTDRLAGHRHHRYRCCRHHCRSCHRMPCLPPFPLHIHPPTHTHTHTHPWTKVGDGVPGRPLPPLPSGRALVKNWCLQPVDANNYPLPSKKPPGTPGTPGRSGLPSPLGRVFETAL